MERIGNRWKVAFIILFSSLLVLIVSLFVSFYLLFPKVSEYEHIPIQQSGESFFTITTTKEKLNHFLAEQIGLGSGRAFEIFLSEEVILEAVIPLFGRNVPFQLFLAPEVQDGNLLLRSKQFQIGEFQLPAETLFRVIKHTLEFPEWLTVDPENTFIFLRLNEIEAMETMYIRIIKFDLVNDEIEFELVSNGYEK